MIESGTVARIQSICGTEGRRRKHYFAKGEFWQIRPPSGNATSVLEADAVVIRKTGHDSISVAHADQTLRIGDLVRTGPDTLLCIEFLIGGRVSVNINSTVRLVSDRSVIDGEQDWRTMLSRFFRSDLANIDHPIEIQTNGGTIGIKG